jgi:hypothetical protein
MPLFGTFAAASNKNLGLYRKRTSLIQYESQSNTSGLFGRRYSGYFADDVNWFATATLSGTSKAYTTINTNWTEGGDNFSIEWQGYFKASITGTWNFKTTSDDASWIWMGATALSGWSTSNALVNNSGLHGSQTVSGNISLVAGNYYPIRVQFGEQGGGEVMIVNFTPPSGIETTNGTGYYFYNSVTNGY